MLIQGLQFGGDVNYLASEILRSKMCCQWSEIWSRRDYLGSDISRTSLSKPFSLYRNCTADSLGSLKKLV